MGLKTRLLASGKTEDNEFNISLLGFKMAVNEGLTVFNLVDGIVDEFHDESGTDEAEGSNDLYCATSDYYINSTSPSGVALCISAGYGLENHLTNIKKIPYLEFNIYMINSIEKYNDENYKRNISLM